MEQVKIFWTQEKGERNYYFWCPECGNKCSVDETETSMCCNCGEIFEVIR